MITIFKTNTFKQAANYVNDVLKRVDQRNLDVNHFVIVPDRASLEAERSLLDAIGGSFNVQVRTFRRLANMILPQQNYLTKSAGIMLLSTVIADNKDKLACYTKSTDTQGFVADVYDTISMLKYCRITPDQLTAHDLPKHLAPKVTDIALIYKLYLEKTADCYVDSADKMDLLCQNIAQSKLIENSYFYLYDFDNFSSQELALVEQLILHSKGVTVACCYSDAPYDRNLYLNDIFNGVVEVCRKNGITPSIVEKNAYSTQFSRQIGKFLYRQGAKNPIETSDVEIHSSSTRTQEVYQLAHRISKFVRQGNRYKDVYVVCSDVNNYKNAVETVFKEFDLPYFIDKQFALGEHVYARFVTDYVAMFQNGFSLNSVLPWVKNPLFCCDSKTGKVNEDVFLFENFCLKYNISHDFSPFDIGLEDDMCASAEKIREKLFSITNNVILPQSAPVCDYTALIRKLIEVTNLQQIVTNFATLQGNFDFSAESDATKQVADKFENVLKQAENILANREVSLDEFATVLGTAISAVNISVVPAKNDCVVFANMAKARKHDINFLALLGANYGAMPIVKRESKLLSDKNINDLATVGLHLEPKILTENQREKFSLFQLLQEPKKLYVSYPTNDGSNTLLASPFVDELSKLFTSGDKNLLENAVNDTTVYTKEQAISELILNKRYIKDSMPMTMPSFDFFNKLYGKNADAYDFLCNGDVKIQCGKQLYLAESTTSVSKITEFYRCPYKFFLQYGLGVKPRATAELKKTDLGNILHAVLEKYVRQMDKTESDEKTVALAQNIFDKVMQKDAYAGIVRDKTLTGTIANLKNEAATMCNVVKHHFATSKFENNATELKFGPNQVLPPVEISFGTDKMLLVGTIDRVDTWNNHFIVIDYKSGGSASKFGEKELYCGLKLQLLVYLTAIQKAFGLIPAGYYYFNLHDNFTNPDEEGVYFYNGRTLKDPDVAKALDVTLEKGKSTRLGFGIKPNGIFSNTSKQLEAKQIENQQLYAQKLLEKTVKLLADGYASVSPCENACTYCDFASTCNFGDVLNYSERKIHKTINAKTIDKAVNDE